MIKYGVYMSNEDYHANPAISRSGIKLFNESPYKYWAHYLNPNRPPKKTTDAMEFGSAFHTYVLEPHLFDELYIREPIIPKLPSIGLKRDLGEEEYKKRKAHREYVAQSNRDQMKYFENQMKNKIVLKAKDFESLYNMSLALKNHPQAWSLIQGARYEESYFWMDEHSGLMVKCRPDILHHNAIIDLKTCTSADSRSYQKDMYLGDYHTQGAMIREGVKQLTGIDIPTIINICIEKTYPYAIGIKIISASALEAGHMKYKNTLLQMKECFDENKWNSYDVEEVELPSWAK